MAKKEIPVKPKLPVKLFGVKPNEVAVAQTVRVYLANQRRAHAKTKTRAEVAKTTAKMYRQKGTGRARHGSHAAPIFVGGGIAHGPTGGQNYHRKLPAAIGRLALASVLSDKAGKDRVKILPQGIKIKKTKDAVLWLEGDGLRGVKTLVVTGRKQKELARCFRNIPKVTTITQNQLNAYTVLNHQTVVMSEARLAEAEETYVH